MHGILSIECTENCPRGFIYNRYERSISMAAHEEFGSTGAAMPSQVQQLVGQPRRKVGQHARATVSSAGNRPREPHTVFRMCGCYCHNSNDRSYAHMHCSVANCHCRSSRSNNTFGIVRRGGLGCRLWVDTANSGRCYMASKPSNRSCHNQRTRA